MTDFEVTELETSGLDDDIFLQGANAKSLEQYRQEYRANRRPVVGDDYDDFDIVDIDWTFGLKNVFPGLGKLMSL